jgi:hypothetical protein
MRQWEHKIVIDRVLMSQTVADASEDPEREQLLDRYGLEGWELVSVVAQSYRRETDPTIHYNYTLFRYYFKREIQAAGKA